MVDNDSRADTVSFNSNKINFLYLNVCGLKKRLLCPDFVGLIADHDICIFVETKLSDLDNLDVPVNYECVKKNRKKCKKASGGIAVLFKKELKSVIKFHDTKNEFILWFQLSKTFFQSVSDLLFGCVYIPPENSSYSSAESFNEIETDILYFSSKSISNIALIGDFNAKTGVLQDYIVPDQCIVDMFDIESDKEILEFMYDFENLRQYDIPLQRVTKCSCTPNSYGHKLLNLCKKTNIYIANSRVGEDKGVGEKTCL